MGQYGTRERSCANHPARGIRYSQAIPIKATAERRADALVIGASRRLTPDRMTVRVMRRVACPAVVVP